MLRRILFIAAGCLTLGAMPLIAATDEKVMSDALGLRDQGEFDKAARALQTYLDQTSATLDEPDKRSVQFEIERIRRIRQDYELSREQLLEQLLKRLSSFSGEELDAFEREGKLDVQQIDGQKLYVNSSASNLLLRVPELQQRLIERKPDTMYRTLFEQMLRAKGAEKLTSSPMILPQDYAVTYTLTVKPNAAPDGKTIRCWLPFVRSFPYHADIAILSTEPSEYQVAAPEAAHRTVYMERAAHKDQPTTFSISFVYRSWARATHADPAQVQPYNKEKPEYAYFTAERKPHLDFSNEELKRISGEIAVGETNPLLLAKRIYDWIGHNTIYQYAREYSTLDNIALYTATRRAGDCGQHAMLFIALCRMNGIPARWTTGWESFNARGQNMHDWCEMYIEPYGWIPADPDMAVNILNHADDELTTGQRTELADWLFGNMDNARLTVNSDFGMPLSPEKQDFRSETVDFQRGEVESEGKNIYFDQWRYSMRIKPIAPEIAESLRAQFIPPPVKMPAPPPAPAKAETTGTEAMTTETVPGDQAVIAPLAPTQPSDTQSVLTATTAFDAVTSPSDLAKATVTAISQTSASLPVKTGPQPQIIPPKETTAAVSTTSPN